MNFNSFLNHLSEIKDKPLGGIESQFKMAPKLRLNFDEAKIAARNPRTSAVMALFYPDKENQTCFLLIERPNYNGTHAQQVSFVGGKKDETDITILDTALRETYEETGINQADITIFRQMNKTYIPPSNFWVIPFIGYVNFTPKFIDNREVEQFIEVKLNDLLNDASLTTKVLNISYMKAVEVPCFKLNNHIVWGATAMILSEIKDLIK